MTDASDAASGCRVWSLINTVAAGALIVMAAAAAGGALALDDSDSFRLAASGDVVFSTALAALLLLGAVFFLLPAVSVNQRRVLVRRDLRWWSTPLSEVATVYERTGHDGFVSSLVIERVSEAQGKSNTPKSSRVGMRMTWRASSPRVVAQADRIWAAVGRLR